MTTWLQCLAYQAWNMPDGIGTVIGSVIGGAFVLTAALVAWQSVQKQIISQQGIESDRQRQERQSLETALTAELLVFATAIIRATSMWNRRALQNPTVVVTVLPKLIRPRVYEAFITKIGLLEEGWPAAAVITFYALVLEANEIADETAHGRPTVGENAIRVADRFKMMAINLAEALNGLNNDRQFPVPNDPEFSDLIAPDGTTIGRGGRSPTSLQESLLALGGRLGNPS